MLAVDLEILPQTIGTVPMYYVHTDPQWCLNQNSVLLGHETLSLGSWSLTFRRNIMTWWHIPEEQSLPNTPPWKPQDLMWAWH